MFRTLHIRHPHMGARCHLGNVHDTIQQAFRDFTRDLPDYALGEHTAGQSHVMPEAKVWETESEYRMVLDMPGADPSSIDVEVLDEQLVIRAQRKFVEHDDADTVHLNELTTAAYLRKFAIPSDMDAQNAEAQYTNGVLCLTLPKIAETPAKKIPVRDAKGGVIERIFSKSQS